MDDLKALLDLKQQIETIKKETNTQQNAEARRLKFEELKIAMNEVNLLKESVEKRMKTTEELAMNGIYEKKNHLGAIHKTKLTST